LKLTWPRSRLKRILIAVGGLLALTFAGLLVAWQLATRLGVDDARIGTVVDRYNGVAVYYNGAVGHVEGRNKTADGYNLGLRYQCVEFVKRYYYERFGHKMPDAMGHAKDFFDPRVADGQLNPARQLVQHRNGGASKPQPDDLIVFAAWALNPYGHVAIVSEVGDDHLEVVQQNPGPTGNSRERYALVHADGQWRVEPAKVLGWLRRVEPTAASAPAPPPRASAR
jgi:hypothetical protein